MNNDLPSVEIRQDELDELKSEVERLRNLIDDITNTLDHNEGEAESAIVTAIRLCEHRLPNAKISGGASPSDVSPCSAAGDLK